MQLGNLFHLAADDDVQFAETFISVPVIIEEDIIRFQNAGINLDQRILTDIRIGNGLEYISGLRLGEVVVCLEDFVIGGIDAGNLDHIRAGEILYDIGHQGIHTSGQCIGAHEHGNDGAFMNAHTHCRTDLILREGLTAILKIALHEFFAGLSYCLEKNLTADGKVFL